MNNNETAKEILIIVLAATVLALTVAFHDHSLFYYAAISFLIIITTNVLAKKIVGFFLEIDVKTKFWSWYQYGFRTSSHFKTPLPMVWLPLLLSLISKGTIWWFAILEFDVKAKTERVSRRHGLYRFAQVTEWHVAWIATWALIANLALAIVGYIAGFELFTRLSIYFIAWSIIPLSSLDGSKIFFGSKGLWAVVLVATAIILSWTLIVV